MLPIVSVLSVPHDDQGDSRFVWQVAHRRLLVWKAHLSRVAAAGLNWASKVIERSLVVQYLFICVSPPEAQNCMPRRALSGVPETERKSKDLRYKRKKKSIYSFLV